MLAHVDAGKTTLSEAMLYQSGSIRKAGRVDNGDAFLDNYELERTRGITIFSKQAVIRLPKFTVTLLDTPGHVDFSAEMERTLQVLDYAVLVISGADGVQGHTKTLWRLLDLYRIPVFLFVNKMDQPGTDRERLLKTLKRELSENCADYTDPLSFHETAAMGSENALEQYLETGKVEQEELKSQIAARRLYPCFFGSALRLEGVSEFLEGLQELMEQPPYPAEFGAKVFKIARDAQGSRLTYLKITGGRLKVRMPVADPGEGESCRKEKVNQIRIYSGEKYETADEVYPGTVCAVTGLNETYPGEGLGIEQDSAMPVLEPVLTCQIILPEGTDAERMLPKLRQIEEEEPELHIVWNEQLQELQAQLMGEVQTEVLKSLIRDRFGVDVAFGEGNIVYRETIADAVEGVGHFEPLRHYAEVHLLLEPQDAGSGLTFATDCREDMLDRNWQNLVLTQLEEAVHPGVLTGSAITDMKITLVSGRAHIKHTEGGDFRQAAFRAVRQGLMQAQSVLLEPYYEFRLEIPEKTVGRAMTDIEQMYGTVSYDDMVSAHEAGYRILTGSAPVSAMRNYQREVTAYTRGEGRLFCTVSGYRPCHNTEEVIERIGYDPKRDISHPASSVFCAHGAGFAVPWDRVEEYMHLDYWQGTGADTSEQHSTGVLKMTGAVAKTAGVRTPDEEEAWLATEEIDRILDRAYNANKKDRSASGKSNRKSVGKSVPTGGSAAVTRTYRQKQSTEEYLIVDGYNIIFAWDELKNLAAETIDGARGRLLDILSNYQGIRKCQLIVVFDAYRVKGHETECTDYHNIHVVYTKEAETADQYIEKFAHENGRKYRVTVATSDALEQIIIRGAGCLLLSARELEEEINRQNRQIQEEYQNTVESGRRYLLDGMLEKKKEGE